MAEQVGKIQGGFDKAMLESTEQTKKQIAKNNLEFAQSMFEKSKKLCEIKMKPEPKETRDQSISACTKFVFNSVMSQWLNNETDSYSRNQQEQLLVPKYNSNSTSVYTSDECVGAIVNGVCHGSIIPKTGYHRTCHGQMLNGQCTGPMF